MGQFRKQWCRCPKSRREGAHRTHCIIWLIGLYVSKRRPGMDRHPLPTAGATRPRLIRVGAWLRWLTHGGQSIVGFRWVSGEIGQNGW